VATTPPPFLEDLVELTQPFTRIADPVFVAVGRRSPRARKLQLYGGAAPGFWRPGARPSSDIWTI